MKKKENCVSESDITFNMWYAKLSDDDKKKKYRKLRSWFGTLALICCYLLMFCCLAGFMIHAAQNAVYESSEEKLFLNSKLAGALCEENNDEYISTRYVVDNYVQVHCKNQIINLN
jgi:hypothetical protein